MPAAPHDESCTPPERPILPADRQVASIEGCFEAVKALAEAGADLNSQSYLNSMTPLRFLAARVYRSGDDVDFADCVAYLLQGPRSAEVDLTLRSSGSACAVPPPRLPLLIARLPVLSPSSERERKQCKQQQHRSGGAEQREPK